MQKAIRNTSGKPTTVENLNRLDAARNESYSTKPIEKVRESVRFDGKGFQGRGGTRPRSRGEPCRAGQGGTAPRYC